MKHNLHLRKLNWSSVPILKCTECFISTETKWNCFKKFPSYSLFQQKLKGTSHTKRPMYYLFSVICLYICTCTYLGIHLPIFLHINWSTEHKPLAPSGQVPPSLGSDPSKHLQVLLILLSPSGQRQACFSFGNGTQMCVQGFLKLCLELLFEFNSCQF